MFEPEVKHGGPVTVVFMEMRGPYEQAGSGFKRLYEWVEHYGLQPAGMPQAIFVTMPDVTPEEEAEWELWAPIAGGAGKTDADEDGIGVKRVEPDLLATLLHKGPYSSLEGAHSRLSQWVADQGYEIIGPSREVYHSGPEVPEAETLTEVQVPISRR